MPTKLLALGSNSSGQLGIGHKNDVSSPTPCVLAEPGLEPDERIQALVAGGNHTLLLTTDGRVFAAGSNESGRCGLPVSIKATDKFRHVGLREPGTNEPARVTHIAATWEASLFVVEERRIYAVGKGEKGELGLGDGCKTVSEPRLVFDVGEGVGDRVKTIVASMAHIVVLTQQHRLYGWGVGRKGQLGENLMDSKVIWRAAEIQLPKELTSFWQVVVGRDFTFLVDDQGHNTVWGNKAHFGGVQLSELKVPSDARIYAGWSNVFIHRQGKLDGVGRNNHGQLPSEELMTLQSGCELFATGSEHSLALLSDCQVTAWGWGEHGNCGSVSEGQQSRRGTCNVLDIEMQRGQRVDFLGAGCATSFVAISSAT